MPRNYDSDKPKKSWREIDQKKDSSSHRPMEKRGMNAFQQARSDAASQVYRSKLDNFFDGEGKAPEHVKDKVAELKDISGSGKARNAGIKKIQEASTSSAKTRAVAEFLKQWELPPDHAVLLEVLSCSDEEYQEMAMDAIGALLKENRPPKRTAVLEQRLKRIVSLAEEPSIGSKARELLKQLRLFS